MSDKFDIQYGLLPPDLRMRLWVLALDANTSRVNLAYNPGQFRSNLSYAYGGNITASLGVRRFTFSSEINPSSGDTTLRLGMVYRGFDFRASASPTQPSVGLNLTYGRKLLPFPAELNQTFNAANGGLMNMVGDIGAAPNNPLAWYRLHSDDADTIKKAVELGQSVADQRSSSERFGFSLRLNYAPQNGFLIYGAAGVWF
jgi:hypothetical protein